jgi:hypothetical protein
MLLLQTTGSKVTKSPFFYYIGQITLKVFQTTLSDKDNGGIPENF